MKGYMRGSIWAVCGVATLFISVMVSSVPVEAKQIAGTLKIDEGQHYGWRLDVAIPSQIDFRIEGLNGSRVDVLVLDQTNYTLYSEGKPFDFYVNHSSLDTANDSHNMTVLSGSVFVVVDNSNAPSLSGAAAPNGVAEIRYWIGSSFDFSAIPDHGSPWMVYVALAGVAFTFVLVIYLTRRAIKSRKRSESA